MRPGTRVARWPPVPPVPPAVTLAHVPGARRTALVVTEAVGGAVLVVLTATHWRTPTRADLAGTVILVAACACTRAALPWVSAPDRDDSGLAGVADLSSLVLVFAVLVLPISLLPLLCLPIVAVDHLWAKRPLFAVVVDAVALSAITQVAGGVRETLAPGPADGGRWAVAAWAAAVVATAGTSACALLGRWIVRGVPPDWPHVAGSVLIFQKAAIAATAVLGATLWRIDPPLAIYMIGPVAVLQRLLSFGEVQAAARTDGKTGLYNYRYFEECAQRELGRARRTGSPLALLMLDMDHLRDINNTFGHQSGDRALLHVAQVLSSRARRYDVVCRFGGEEFLVLLPGTPLRAAAEAAERLREEVRGTTLLLGDRAVTVSISIGVAELGPVGSLERLLADADARVYAAKRAGRDRVVAGPLPV